MSLLGVPVTGIQRAQESCILVALDRTQVHAGVVEAIQSPGLLEFVDFSTITAGTIPERMCVLTTEQARRAETSLPEGASPNQYDQYTCPGEDPFDPKDEPAWLQNGQPFLTIMSNSGVKDAVAQQNNSWWGVSFNVEKEAVQAEDYFNHLAANANRPIGMVLDGRLLSYPTITSSLAEDARIRNENASVGYISGLFSEIEARALAVQLRSGEYPLPFRGVPYDVDVALPPACNDATGTSMSQHDLDEPAVAGASAHLADDSLGDPTSSESAEGEALLPDHAITQVNGEIITTDKFQECVRFRRWQTAQQLRSYYLQTNDVSQIEPYLVQLADPVQFGIPILTEMEENLLIEQTAKERGVTVSEAEVDQRIDEYMTESLGLTPPQDQTAIQATLEWALTDFFTAATEGAGVSHDTIRKVFYYDALRQALLQAIGEELPTEELQVNVRHILLSFDPSWPAGQSPPRPTDEQKAVALVRSEAVLQALQDGVPFADLAAEVSDDTGSASRGGELGWTSPDTYVDNFADTVREAGLGEIVGPIETEFGYHIIQVNGREVRPLTPSEISSRRQQAFQDWIADAQRNADIGPRHKDWIGQIPGEPTYNELLSDILPIGY